MNSNNELKTEDYSIEVIKSDPQIIDSKKSHFLFDNKNKRISISPRRDIMPLITNSNNNIRLNFPNCNFNNNNYMKHNTSNNLTISIPCPVIHIKESDDPIRERIEQKINENIKNREGFENLLQDPDINKYINN